MKKNSTQLSAVGAQPSKIPANLAYLRINAKEMKVLNELIGYGLECAEAERDSHIGSGRSVKLLMKTQQQLDRFQWLAQQLSSSAAKEPSL
jgi:hypothetical protein